MSPLKKVSVLLLILIVGLTVFYSSSIRTTFYTATGFSAKNICSGYFISGFSTKLIKDEALIPVSILFSLVDYTINDEKKSVTTDIFGFYKRKSVFNKGVGCALLAIDQTELNRKVFSLASLRNKNKYYLSDDTNISEKNTLAINKVVSNAFDIELENTKENKQNKTPNRNTKAVVILHKGKVIAEKYASGVEESTPLLSWSMAKSVTGLLVGVLVKDKQLDIFAANLLPQWSDLQKHKNINLDQLLRMSSGLEFNEIYGVGSDAAKMLSVEASASDYAADKNILHPIDTHWSYSSGTSNIISAIIKKEVGGTFQYYYEFAQQRLFRPLGIESAIIEADASGTFIGSSYMYMTARDWAKLGQLCLQNGQWEGRRVLPDNWIKYVTTPTKTSKQNQYGAHFWLNKNPENKELSRHWPSLPTDLYYMSGFQGQTVAIIPSKELVVVRLGFTPPGVERGTEKLIHDVIELL